jgi:predicted MFS family arabinose efflux permease
MTTGVPRFFPAVYLAFATGYVMSFFFRNVNAVLSPEITREFGLAPGALGLLTAVYFVTFTGMQVPAGILLDRFGPRRVEPVLLLVAAAGALAFSLAGGEAGLLFARGLVGMGVSVCLMAPMKAVATWYPERQASLAGWIMVAGTLGALGATAPLELALRVFSWRGIFAALAAVTAFAAILIAWRVPDIAHSGHAASAGAQWAGVRSVFAHPRFRWIAPLAAAGFGAFTAAQGLWAVPWLVEVGGEPRAGAARLLLVVGATMLAGYFSIGALSTRLARRGLHPRHLFAGGFALALVAFAAIVADVPGGWLWWPLFGLGITTNVLAFPVLNQGFATELAGRANTALNMTMFAGAFALQWGVGAAVDAARAVLGVDLRTGLRIAFVVVLILYACAFAWFVRGWRRYAVAGSRAPAA